MYLSFQNADGAAEVETDHDLTFDEIDTMFDEKFPRAHEAWRDRDGIFEVDAHDRVRQVED